MQPTGKEVSLARTSYLHARNEMCSLLEQHRRLPHHPPCAPGYWRVDPQIQVQLMLRGGRLPADPHGRRLGNLCSADRSTWCSSCSRSRAPPKKQRHVFSLGRAWVTVSRKVHWVLSPRVSTQSRDRDCLIVLGRADLAVATSACCGVFIGTESFDFLFPYFFLLENRWFAKALDSDLSSLVGSRFTWPFVSFITQSSV